MKILLDKPMQLDLFLAKYKGNAELRNKRLIYVLAPNLEKGRTVKVGIAGMSDGDPVPRLQSYIATYGISDRKNNCKGTTLHFIGVTEYNKNVLRENSKIYKTEQLVIETYKRYRDARGERAKERFIDLKPSLIINTIKRGNVMLEDQENKLDRVARTSTKKYRHETTAFTHKNVS